MYLQIFDQQLFDSRSTRVDIEGDNITVTYRQDGAWASIESWGEFGPNDYNDFGFRVTYNRP